MFVSWGQVLDSEKEEREGPAGDRINIDKQQDLKKTSFKRRKKKLKKAIGKGYVKFTRQCDQT